MKNILLVLAILGCLHDGNCQKTNNACDLLSTAQINSLLGVSVKEGKSMMQNKYCVHKADDNRIQVIVQYVEFSNPQAAQNLLKMAFDENDKSIRAGKKAEAIYTALKPFSDAGPMAYYETSPGNDFVPGNQLRFQFVLGKALFSFDTRSVDMNKVIPKLGAIYKTLKENYQL